MEHYQESRKGLEKKREEDIKLCQELNEKLIRTEAELRSVHDQLFMKEKLIIELSEQLKLHQDNFSKLRDELENTVIHQSELYDGYSKEIGQIEAVLQSFQRDSSVISSPYKNKVCDTNESLNSHRIISSSL